MSDSISALSGSSNFSATSAADRAKKFFSKLDANGDGQLDASELASMVKNGPQGGPSAADLLKKMDTNGDGSVSESEFAAAAPKHGHHHKAKGANDGDADDQSGATGAATSADGKSQLFAELLKAIQGASTTSANSNASANSSNTSADDLFASMDADKNGSISKSEVQTFLAKMKQQATQGTLYSADGTTSSGSSDPLLDIQA